MVQYKLVLINKFQVQVVEWIPCLITNRKYPGSNRTKTIAFLSNSTGYDLHDVILGFCKFPSGYATHFLQVIIRKNRIVIKNLNVNSSVALSSGYRL